MAADGTLDARRHHRALEHEPFWKFRFTPCEHGAGDLVRLRRPSWLRLLLPKRRLYQCPHCGTRVLYAR